MIHQMGPGSGGATLEGNKRSSNTRRSLNVLLNVERNLYFGAGGGEGRGGGAGG